MTTAAIENEAKPKLYARVITENFDDLTNSIVASAIAVVFDMLKLTIKNAKPCETKVEFKETEDAITMIIRKYCLAVTHHGHLHLRGEKIAKKGKYRTIYEIRLEDQLSGETG
jgi:hypothetical protein